MTADQAHNGGPLPEANSPECSPRISMPDHSISAVSAKSTATEDGFFPLCLLCSTRPPSAVVLPCCHLNLCYLCAPLLMIRQPPIQSSPSTTEDCAPRSPTWDAILTRATANHPKSRKLSMGGYVAPEMGLRGGEMRGRDLIPTGQGEITEGMDISCAKDLDGRITLADLAEEQSGARCLVCRSSIQGWLRVYTG